MSVSQAPPKGSMRLYRSIEPPLDAGSYRVKVGSDTTRQTGGAAVGAAELARHFDIEAPRFTMAASEVAGVFPPRNARGQFDDTLAHLALGRRTLPYERVHAASSGPRIPWLALLVLAEGEPSDVRSDVALSTVLPPAVYKALAPRADELCDALDVPLGTLFGLMPSRNELRLLTHVRQVNVEDRELAAGDSDGWFGVVVSSRIIEQGKRYRAFLVSVEGRTDVVPHQSPDVGPQRAHDLDADVRRRLPELASATQVNLAAKRSLVLLHSWQFEAGPGASFLELGQKLDVAMMGTPRDGRPKVADTGHLPIRVTDRAGLEETCWYRGPLVPHRLGRDTLGPYHSADQARRLDPVTALEDVSYAAAFELGRMIAMSDARLAQEVAAWRRGAYRRAAQLGTFRGLREANLAQLGPELLERFRKGALPALAIGALGQIRPGLGPLVNPSGIDLVADAIGLQPDALMRAWNLGSVQEAGRLLGVDGAGALGGDVGVIGRTDRSGFVALTDLTTLTGLATELELGRDALLEPAVREVAAELGLRVEDLANLPFDHELGGGPP